MPIPIPIRPVAYFSMEVGLEPAMPTYSGGLGVLAGDTLRAAADLGLPMVGVTLLHHKGYFHQHLDTRGNQSEAPATWEPEKLLEPQTPRVTVTLEGRPVRVCAWRYLVCGVSGRGVPVYFLDTALPENSPWDQTLTDYLYGGDPRYRLCQEIVLGMGGVAMLRALGHTDLQTYHMNEGHSAFLTLRLLAEQSGGAEVRAIGAAAREAVRHRCVFTTHTPVPAGHDQFPAELVRRVLGTETTAALARECCLNGTLNMTYLALYFARYVNGVAMRHGEISRDMFPNYPVNSITNGVHAATWAATPFQRLYDRHIPEWRRDNLYLRYAISIPVGEVQQAHTECRRELLDEVERRQGARLDPAALTIGFARRATPYKRPDLLFTNLGRLRRIVEHVGPIQVLYAGKAHPRDESGKAMIRRVFEAAAALGERLRVLYLPEYDMALAKLLCAGVDLWLNTPRKPQEASGTSGMKAALNGVPSLSILDGWWIEGHCEGVTGWAIGDAGPRDDPVEEATSLYDKLEYVILPMFFRLPLAFSAVMRRVIAWNASFFNAQRMLGQYVRNAYLPSPDAPIEAVPVQP
ncbi:MAG TPA: alpha-glucan family phosphorylase [Gemmataceae bacterium]|jgi:starch phosphorylase